MSKVERVVIVGAGLTGLRSAERLRELGFNGEVLIIGEERLPPYHRPALSKQLLMGTMRPNDLMLPAYRDVGARWRLGTRVEYLSPRTRTVHLPGGEEISYDGLVIATGVEAKRPNDVPYDDPRVVVMRTMQDALDLERAMTASRGPVAVVGGGFTGCEIAASMRHLGREVTIIGRSKTLLGNVLGDQLGDWLTSTHRDHGVDLALGASVRRWQPTAEGIGLYLSDGTSMLASCVVLAAGTQPSTAWLRGSGLPLDNGVVCDPTCHVVGAEDIVAAGDVAQWPNLRFDEVPRRIEHWLNAIEMGRAAAESLMLGRESARPFTPMPRFWTEQYGVRIQAAGVPKLGTDTVSLSGDGSGTVVGYVRAGRLVGVVGVDCPSSVLTWTETVAEQNPIPGAPRVARGLPPAASERERTPAPVPAMAAASSSRTRGPRHSLPARQKREREETRQQVSGNRLRLPESSNRRRQADSSNRLRPVDSNPRLPAVDANPRIPPLDAPRLRPADSNPRMQPVEPNPPTRPTDSNPRMRPVESQPRMRPVDSQPRMRPVDPNPRVRAVDSSPRMRPVDSQPRMRPVDPQPRMRPVDPNPPMRPADSNPRMRPVSPPPAPAEVTSWIPRLDFTTEQRRPVPPPRPNPADSNPRMRPVPPPPQPDPLAMTSWVPTLDANGHLRSTLPPPPSGRHTQDTNGRMRPLEDLFRQR